jgi:prophage antirepressor-like protein
MEVKNKTMNNIKIENWNGHEIRFVFHSNEWFAIANDVARVLEYGRPNEAISAHCKGTATYRILTNGGEQRVKIIPEIDIYNLIFKAADQSRNKKIKTIAEEFKKWVFAALKELRENSGLEGFQVFRMLDKEHQKEVMTKLKDSLKKPVRIDFVKANTIANKAVSNMNNYPRMIKKKEMEPLMLVQRQSVLEDTVELMSAVDKFNLDCSVSEKIYEKYH